LEVTPPLSRIRGRALASEEVAHVGDWGSSVVFGHPLVAQSHHSPAATSAAHTGSSAWWVVAPEQGTGRPATATARPTAAASPPVLLRGRPRFDLFPVSHQAVGQRRARHYTTGASPMELAALRRAFVGWKVMVPSLLLRNGSTIGLEYPQDSTAGPAPAPSTRTRYGQGVMRPGNMPPEVRWGGRDAQRSGVTSSSGASSGAVQVLRQLGGGKFTSRLGPL
jgi:hypothetical protein